MAENNERDDPVDRQQRATDGSVGRANRLGMGREIWPEEDPRFWTTNLLGEIRAMRALYGAQSQEQEPEDLEALLRDLGMARQPPTNPVPNRAPDLPSHVLNEDNLKDSFGNVLNCSICLNDVQVGETVKSWPNCGHTYHGDCVDRWIEHQRTCPLCRRGLDGENERVSA